MNFGEDSILHFLFTSVVGFSYIIIILGETKILDFK